MRREQFDNLIGRILDAAPDLSDIVIAPGKPVQASVSGQLQNALPGGDERVLPAHTKAMAGVLIGTDERLAHELDSRGACDLPYALPGRARFRVNVFSQRGSLALVMRQLPHTVPDIESLGLPEVFSQAASEHSGLVLVAGATGSGKSTSLAALTDAVNARRATHVLTLEDPVEFVHSHKKATVNQRELGMDFDTFATGMRAAFRQSPGVILLGEVRDRETMEIVLQAASTGHLILSTIHASDASSAIARIIGLFSPSEERQVRMRLAESLRCVVAQRLLPATSGDRVCAFEILRNTLAVRELLLGGESAGRSLHSIIEDGQAHGMRSFDQEIASLYEAGAITLETASLSASDRGRLTQLLDHIRTRRGEDLTEVVLEGLEPDEDDDVFSL